MGRYYIRYVTDEKLNKVSQKNKSLVDKYFNFKNMNLSESSKKSYMSDFNQWLVFINDRYEKGAIDKEYILDIIEDDIDEMVDLIEDYIAFCTSVLQNNERRIQRRMSSISSFFLFLRKKRKIKENPIDFLDRPSVSAGEKTQIKQTFLSKEQVEEIRKELKLLGNLQLEMYFEISISTMARVNAVSNIKIDQIDFEGKKINDILEKEGKKVTLLPSDRALKLVKKWMKYRKDNGINNEYLFVTKYGGDWKKVTKGTMQSHWVKKIGGLIGIPELHAHDLRHSGSNLLFHSGMTLEDVSLLLSHSGTDVTRQHYLKVDLNSVQDKKSSFEV